MKKKIILRICFVLSLIFLFISIIFPADKKNYFYHLDGLKNSYELNKNDIFIEEYTSSVDNLNGIGLLFISDNKEDCTIDVSLLENNNAIFEEKISNKTIRNDQYQIFEFDKITDSNGKKFKLNIKNNCSNGVSLYFYENDDSTLFYNNDNVDYGIFFYEIGMEKSYEKVEYALVIIIIVLIPIIMEHNYGRKGGRKNDKKSY